MKEEPCSGKVLYVLQNIHEWGFFYVRKQMLVIERAAKIKFSQHFLCWFYLGVLISFLAQFSRNL